MFGDDSGTVNVAAKPTLSLVLFSHPARSPLISRTQNEGSQVRLRKRMAKNLQANMVEVLLVRPHYPFVSSFF
jgi:hypothetical protein